MTGREKMDAAFSEQGTPKIPAVICYEGIFMRDHIEELLDPIQWWNIELPDLESQAAWRKLAFNKIGQDWFFLPYWNAREEIKDLAVEIRYDGVYRINKKDSVEEKLLKDPVGGKAKIMNPPRLVDTFEEIDELIPVPSTEKQKSFIHDGRKDLADRLLKDFTRLYPTQIIESPISRCYKVWGFEGMMTMIATEPELVKHVCNRTLEFAISRVHETAALGASGIWIEEIFTDLISPDAYRTLSYPYVKTLIDEIHNAGMKSIYYFCGNPSGKIEDIIATGTDAISFEEGKKNFNIDIDDLVDIVKGRCTILGNLDSIAILQDGTEEELRAEISRQIAAGRRNGSRFIMSLGSPVTPGTPIERVRLYTDMVHEIGSK